MVLCLPWLRVILKTNLLSPHCSSLLLAWRMLTALMFLRGGGRGGPASLYKSRGSAASPSWCSAKRSLILTDGVQNKGDIKKKKPSETLKHPSFS